MDRNFVLYLRPLWLTKQQEYPAVILIPEEFRLEKVRFEQKPTAGQKTMPYKENGWPWENSEVRAAMAGRAQAERRFPAGFGLSGRFPRVL